VRACDSGTLRQSEVATLHSEVKMRTIPVSKDLNFPANRLEVVYCDLDQLKPDSRNARHHSPKQIRRLARSIETFGFTVPALVDGEGNVIAGHGRIMACRQLGLTKIPTIRIDGLSEAKRRALMLADNRLAEIARWDRKLVAEQLRELSVAELDFDLEVIGFETGEIDLRIGEIEGKPPTDDPDDALLKLTTKPATKRGDLWLLGKHRLLCGNALDAASLRAVMGNERADIVFTDLPRNAPIDGHATRATSAGDMGGASFDVFLAHSLRNHAACCNDGALLYLCVDWRHMAGLLAAGRAIGVELENLCVWVRDIAQTGSLYRDQHELVLVFGTGKRRGRFRRNRSNVWQYPAVPREADQDDLRALDPTMKPVALVADAILDYTVRDDIVLDGFLGRGTALIAAERTGRRCFGVELDPAYVDIVIRRWQQLTGDAARHAQSGAIFDDLAREAEAADAL
jgi:DNA modification methylase